MITLRRLHAINVKSLCDASVTFPARGSILVEGPNESGKSTLFESIYFGLYGAAIVTEDNSRALESLITYGEESAKVCLELQANDTTLTINRSVRRGRPTQAKLTIERPGEDSESITGVRAVNSRIIEELGGLDGTALLNSCFVEQKRLSKLEELDARERRDSLLRILNLDQLSKLEEMYKVRAADTQKVALAESRLELARSAQLIQQQTARVEALQRSMDVSRREQLAAALSAAEAERDAAEEHVRALREIVRLQQTMRGDRYEDRLQERQNLRERKARLVLAGAAASSGLLVAALVAFGAGATIPALFLILVILAVAVLAILAFSRTTQTLQELEARLANVHSEESKSRTTVRRLCAELGLPSRADVADELEKATRAAGAAEGAVLQARLQLREIGGSQPEASDVNGTSETTAADLLQAEQSLHALRATARYLSDTLEVKVNALDLTECEVEHAEATRDLEIKQHASVILAETRRRIVQRVLPETERNMKLILPMLTAGRYHDARVTEEYRVELWDESAGRFVSKSVYSGGTKDQVSLALRLAFAIASLPRELGSSPGFLFMDEPLSSFDEERTMALIDLITHGELAAVFPQICIISHSKSFDPSLFPYVIRMNRGQITQNLSNIDAIPQ